MKNISGKQFGKWTVTSEYEIRIKLSGKRETFWLCVCECGTKKYTRGAQLVYGSSTQCKKCSSKKGLLPGEAARNAVLCGYRRDALDRGYEWSLTNEQCFELFKSPCFYCEDLPRNTCKSQFASGNFTYNGIDRKNNKLGYTPDNTVACCRICNRAKSDLNLDEWVSYLSRVATRQKGTEK